MNTATEKQLAFLKRLKAERQPTPEAVQAVQLGYQLWDAEAFDTKAASAVIDVLLAAPLLETPASAPTNQQPPEGMHKVGNEIYKVQVAVHGSGQPYAKRLVLGPRDELTGIPEMSWVYAPGASKALTTVTLMPVEAAQEFGRLYNRCCVCGRVLTDETSVARGIGPICEGRFVK